MIVLEKIELDKIFALENIYYEFNKSNINDPARQRSWISSCRCCSTTPRSKSNSARTPIASTYEAITSDCHNVVQSRPCHTSFSMVFPQSALTSERLYSGSKPIARNTKPEWYGQFKKVVQKNRRTRI